MDSMLLVPRPVRDRAGFRLSPLVSQATLDSGNVTDTEPQTDSSTKIRINTPSLVITKSQRNSNLVLTWTEHLTPERDFQGRDGLGVEGRV